MKKTLLASAALSLLFLLVGNAKAQIVTNPVVMEVGGQQIRQSEFMKDFYTNVGQQLAKKPGVTFAEKQAALDEYAELYAIFRAKLLDAHARGFDTASALQQELMRYRKELAAPYLIDSAVLRALLDEAYKRNQTSLHAAHILVNAPPDASAADTMRALERINKYYKRIVEDGEDFFAVAQENFLRMNPSAKPRANEGDLGWFTVFDMVYPFENAAYSLQVGEVSRPVRTRYGYHIIKLLDRVDGLYGKVTMAHIWLHSPDSATRLLEINSIYQQLSEGIPFERLARQSDDRSTSTTGGLLENASLSQLPPEYIHQVAKMKEGEFSRPFFTQYGWHIIKLIKRDTLPSPEDLDGFYKQRMSRDQRGEKSRKAFAASCRQKYGIVDRTVVPVKTKAKGKKKTTVRMAASLDLLKRVVPDSACYGKWVCDDSQLTDTTVLVTTPDAKYTSLDVAHFIAARQRRSTPEAISLYVQRNYDEFLDSIAIDYADRHLEEEYPEFAQIVNEYRRGLMIFNYNDAMIWHKAINDTVGFVDFYNRESVKKSLDNPEDSIFFYHPRARVNVITITDSAAMQPGKAYKIIAKAHKKQMGGYEMKEQLLKKINRKRFPSNDIITIKTEQVEQTRQNLLRDDQWQEGIYTVPTSTGYRLLIVENVMPRSIKSILNARGYYLNAWQNEIEQKLNNDLRQRYNVKIHRDVIHTITY